MIPLRVAFLTYALHLGGAERWILSLCREFDRKRIIPTVVAVLDWNLRHDIVLKAMPRDVPVLRAEDVAPQWHCFADVVVGWGKCNLGALVVPYGIPAVHCTHGAYLCDFTKQFIADAMTSGAKLAGVNEVCRNVFPEQYRPLMTILENGADEPRVVSKLTKAEAKKKLGIDPNRKVVSHIGRIMQDKNVIDSAKAVGKLPEDWILLACGPRFTGTDFCTMSDAANGRMIVLEARDHIGDVLAATDVFTLLSQSEAHPLAVNEAWLAGVPTVVTDNPWIRFMEKKHDCGLAYKVHRLHDPESVADQIKRAYADQALASNTQRIAKEHYTAGAMARRWEDWLLNFHGE